MATRTYWLDLFTGTTWKEFLDAGGEISGFRESRWKTVQSIKPGDYLLCYLTRVSRFIGVLEVVSEPYRDTTPIWKDEAFPCRLKMKIVVGLTPETAVPVESLKDTLSVLKNFDEGYAWTGHFRGSPSKWTAKDGEAVVQALLAAQSKPVVREIDPAHLKGWPQRLKAKTGLVTVPETEEPAVEVVAPESEVASHTEIQWLLAKTGNDMGVDVWVARNDRNRQWNEHKFTDLPRLRTELPLQFDEATNRTIELIDVLWLRGNAIVSAFEIESTTSIYSGLLRMSDLIAMQPNLNIPLYIVAPDDRRDKVITEVNRPTFARLTVPMSQICRFIAFSELRKRVAAATPFIRHMKTEFLSEVSESCAIEESD